MRTTQTNGLPDRGSKRAASLNQSHDLLEEGEIARQLATVDDLNPQDPEALALLVGHLVDRLQEPWRSCVQMTVLNGLTYEEAAELLEVDLGRKVPRMQTWRWTQYGLRQLEEWLQGASWIKVLLADRIPLEPGDDRSGATETAVVINLSDRR